MTWKIMGPILVILLVLACLSIIRKCFKVGCLLMVVGVVLYILSTHELGPVWQSMVDKSTETMENVTGQSSDELMDRGKGTMDALGNLVDDVMEGMK